MVCCQEEECRVRMSDINAAHVACMQRLSNEGEGNKDNNQEHGDDAYFSMNSVTTVLLVVIVACINCHSGEESCSHKASW